MVNFGQLEGHSETPPEESSSSQMQGMKLLGNLECGALANVGGLERKRKKLGSKEKYRDGPEKAEMGMYGAPNKKGYSLPMSGSASFLVTGYAKA